jgi:hypothetical protein
MYPRGAGPIKEGLKQEIGASEPQRDLVWEVQSHLKQKVGLKFSGVVDFVLRFVIIIESMNFKF